MRARGFAGRPSSWGRGAAGGTEGPPDGGLLELTRTPGLMRASATFRILPSPYFGKSKRGRLLASPLPPRSSTGERDVEELVGARPRRHLHAHLVTDLVPEQRASER